jgi:uncharacterized membrane protein YtjA (UPF0391 family)
MLRCFLALLIFTLIAGLLGFTGIGGEAAGIARIAFYVLLGLLVLPVIAGWIRRSGRSTPDI